MNPENDGTNDPEAFEEIKNIVQVMCKGLKDYEGQAIMLTSHFHPTFPMIHLLMAMYNMMRLFCYASVLPRKIIYPEVEFRDFCTQLINEQRTMNLKTNFDRNLVYENGFLKPGALASPPSSPVQFERSVVPSDQCCFCKRRGFKNLVTHMTMAHGGYALANIRRRWS